MIRSFLQRFWLPTVAAVGFLALTWPTWRWLWSEWLSNDYYSHGLLIVPVAFFLAVQRVRRNPQTSQQTSQGSPYGLVLLAATLVLYIIFFRNRALYLAAFAMVGMIAGLVWAIGGTRLLRKWAFPILYLLLMVPIPFIDRYTLALAMFTGICSGTLVQFLGLDVSIVGNAVTLPNADLVIGAQCSGVNSLIALLAFMVLVAYLLDGPVWSRVLLVLFAIPLALLGNILRVATLLFVARAWGAEAAFAYYHDYSGVLFFVGVLLLIVPLTRLLQFRRLRYEVI